MVQQEVETVDLEAVRPMVQLGVLSCLEGIHYDLIEATADLCQVIHTGILILLQIVCELPLAHLQLFILLLCFLYGIIR